MAFFKKKGNLHEIVECVLFRHELHEGIDIAQGLRSPRTNEPNSPILLTPKTVNRSRSAIMRWTMAL